MLQNKTPYYWCFWQILLFIMNLLEKHKLRSKVFKNACFNTFFLQMVVFKMVMKIVSEKSMFEYFQWLSIICGICAQIMPKLKLKFIIFQSPCKSSKFSSFKQLARMTQRSKSIYMTYTFLCPLQNETFCRTLISISLIKLIFDNLQII